MNIDTNRFACIVFAVVAKAAGNDPCDSRVHKAALHIYSLVRWLHVWTSGQFV